VVKQLLVTTALEETWKEDMPVIFLGEWCKLHARKDKWESLESTVCPYHWDDRDKLFKDYQFTSEIYERVLADLAMDLNKMHQQNMSIRAWRILLGPWLGYFMQMLFDRWCMIQYASTLKGEFQTVVLTGNESDMVPNDMNHFYELYLNDEWNHFIYGCILKKFGTVEIINVQKNASALKNNFLKKNSPIDFFKKSIKSIYNQVAFFLTKKRSPFFFNTYLLSRDRIKLALKYGQLPILETLENPEKIDVDSKQRDWFLQGDSYSAFESFARHLIPKQIPVAYLEGFSMLVKKADEVNWPSQPKLIFTSISFNSDDIFKMYAARNVDRSTSLVIGQHGGHYGIGKWFFNEEHEIAISDKFVSWGWKNPQQPKVTPVGQLKSKKPLRIDHGKQNGILLVTATLPRYSYFMYSIVVSSQWIHYFNDQCAFVENLSGTIRNNLTVRLYKNDFGWDQLQRWKNCFPDVKYDEGQINIEDHIKKSRIFVSTYNATTYLESFTINIPTIIYWNPVYAEIRDTAIPFFEDLKRVGIFHETPESAANFINLIWDGVDSWWNSIEVKEVVNRFKQNFCFLSDNLVATLDSEFKMLIEENSSN
jgi:putative transferase (TIGR04331 family)